MQSPREIPYEALESQWTPLLNRFARWGIAGIEREDLLQELRVVLWKAQQGYDPSQGVSFMTYLYTSCLHQMLNLRRRSQCKLRCPEAIPLSLDEEVLKLTLPGPNEFDDIETCAMVSDVGPEARALTGAILADAERDSWGALLGLNPKQIEEGIEELRIVLNGGEWNERNDEI